jgi:putative exosortase-associated protein (TIGR04073 family)
MNHTTARKLPALFLAGALLALMALDAPASAQVDRRDTTFDKAMHKLGRGLSNILTGWMEIPKEIAVAWRETDPITGVIIGSIKGTGYFVARFFAGFYEVFTFPMPFPEDYKPIIEPEFVLPPIFGEDLPPFEDNAF